MKHIVVQLNGNRYHSKAEEKSIGKEHKIKYSISICEIPVAKHETVE